MPAKIRLQRYGRRKRPFYHIVVADARAPRDGRFIEKIGTYNPMTKPATIDLDREAAYNWLMKGAQPTDTARAILRFKGVMFKKHLQRGVLKGAMSQEAADKQYEAWINSKEAKIEARKQESLAEIAAIHAARSGEKKAVKKKAVEVPEHAPVAEEAKTFAESVEQTTVDETPAAEAPAPVVEKAAPVVEEAAAPVVEKAPAAEEAAPPAKEVTADDLKKIEGIGPKVEEILHNGGIKTYSDLGGSKAEKVKELLTAAGGNFGTMDPTTWPEQSQMAADGKWDELKKWQDELDGGKVVEK